eukprot:scaffold6962_cov54-Phaeocystis_antarctica.AAC.3
MQSVLSVPLCGIFTELETFPLNKYKARKGAPRKLFARPVTTKQPTSNDCNRLRNDSNRLRNDSKPTSYDS